MTAAAAPLGGVGRATSRWLRRAVVALHAVVVAIPVSLVVADSAVAGRPTPAGAAAVLAGLALLGLQLRHSLAAARGQRPWGGVWTLLGLAVLTYVPMRWFGWDWVLTVGLLIASSLMVLPGWPAATIAAAVILVTDVAYVRTGLPAGLPAATLAYETFYAFYAAFALVAAAAAL